MSDVILYDHRGKEIPLSAPRTSIVESSQYRRRFENALRARYDAARTTDENERHWANADYLSPNGANSPSIRRKVRARARYEGQENNSYAKGMILTLANDLIGTGPRLQLMTDDQQANQRVEQSFAMWAREINLAEKLRTMRVAKCVDGEAFAIFQTNPRVASPVQLDLTPIESDFVEFDIVTDGLDDPDKNQAVQVDGAGNPTAYYIQESHPGDVMTLLDSGNWVDSEFVLHVFRADRAGQLRGISELVTALPLFAMLRRFTLATLAAAETAADFAAVLYTDNPAIDATSLKEDEWFDAIPIEYRAMVTMPNGWKMEQFRAEHPSTTYDMFKREIINEIARCLNMPYNVAAANSSDYNYSSGRLDHQTYDKSIDVERNQWECRILDRILMAWFDEAALIEGLLPEGVGPIGDWTWQWHWDSRGHVDPQKSANAQAIKLSTGSTHLAAEYAKEGKDVEKEFQLMAKTMGVSVDEIRSRVLNQIFSESGNVTQRQTAEAETE